MSLNKEIQDVIQQQFSTEQRDQVISELSSIKLQHVMADSEYNLNNTIKSILYLAQSNVDDVIELTRCAKVDFRDVIMWAMDEKKKK